MRNKIRAGRSRGVIVTAVTYVLAFVVAVLAVRVVDPAHPLLSLGLGTLVATVVVFVVSVIVNNSSMYDPYWSLQPLAIAGYYLWTGWAEVNARQVILTTLVFLYTLRLTSNFYRDWPGLAKEDFRYVSFRERFGRAYWPVSFLGIHLFPTIMVYIGCLPLYAAARTGASSLNWVDGPAVVVTLGAILLAYVADEQLRSFRSKPATRASLMRDGLWAYSRHPNYLGEVATWWGLWLFALAAGAAWWWTGIGAVAISVMFVAISIPMMERRLQATRAMYGEYRAQTPMLLPRVCRRAAATDPSE